MELTKDDADSLYKQSELLGERKQNGVAYHDYKNCSVPIESIFDGYRYGQFRSDSIRKDRRAC